MIKLIYLLSFTLLFISATTQAKIKVATTLSTFKSIVEEIGGEQVAVKSLAHPNYDPHEIEAKPSFASLLNRSDLLIVSGLGLESGWIDPLIIQSKNPKIQKGAQHYIEASQGMRILEKNMNRSAISRGHQHPYGNPHAWTDPRNIKILAIHIQKKLSEIDPSNDRVYQENLRKFIQRLDAKIKEWEQKSRKLKGVKVISYHKSLTYLAAWLKFEVVDELEPLPGIPPSSRHMNQLIPLAKNKGVKLILVENYYPKRLAQYLSEKSGLKLVIIKTQTDKNSYFDMMDTLINSINAFTQN